MRDGRLRGIMTSSVMRYGLCACSVVSDSLRPPLVCSPPGSLFRGFSRQEYWTGLPFPSPGDLPDPGNEPKSLALQADLFLFYHLSHQGSPAMM